MTYLEAVNDVLGRLREDSVASVSTNSYSLLIGKFVNDFKTVVEDAWNWDSMSASVNLSTAVGTTNYVVTGSGRKQKDVVVNFTSTNNKIQLKNVPIQWIIDQQDLSTVQSGAPVYYAWNGTNGTDSKVELFPTPDGIYNLRFHMYVPQAKLTTDADIITIPYTPIVLGAYARANLERGEDGGISANEAFAIFKNSMADEIAIESTRFSENNVWEAV